LLAERPLARIPLTVAEAAQRMRLGELSSVELTGAVIARADALDARLGTYLARFDSQALAAAAEADRELASGVDRGPLHGIPVAVKDNLAAREGPTTAQSLVFDSPWVPGYDAPVVWRLRQAGAVLTGKTTLAEFAVGLPDPLKPFPIPRNPWDPRTYAGGSSSGSGSGVATGMFLAAIGTDTGGSIRMPAAWCGVTGLKPTFGRVPKSGCVPLSFSLDSVGPLARSAWDCAAMLRVLAGHDRSDPDSSELPVPDYLAELTGDLSGVRVGVARGDDVLPDSADPALTRCYEDATAALESLGASAIEVSLPLWSEASFATIVTLASDAVAYHRPNVGTRWAEYFSATRALLAQGSLLSAADYVQAGRVRRAAQRRLRRLFGEVDLIVSPTTTSGAFAYDEHDVLPDLEAVDATLLTGYWSAVGYPALAVPMGFTADGLPLSRQVAGRPFDEALVLRAGDAYQRITNWHVQEPPLVREPRCEEAR
jgi:aspartyl-tRNA(Asn)/glutamyl-tRNA(Gln) amidotransferase subunit A